MSELETESELNESTNNACWRAWPEAPTEEHIADAMDHARAHFQRRITDTVWELQAPRSKRKRKHSAKAKGDSPDNKEVDNLYDGDQSKSLSFDSEASFADPPRIPDTNPFFDCVISPLPDGHPLAREYVPPTTSVPVDLFYIDPEYNVPPSTSLTDDSFADFYPRTPDLILSAPEVERVRVVEQPGDREGESDLSDVVSLYDSDGNVLGSEMFRDVYDPRQNPSHLVSRTDRIGRGHLVRI